MSQIRKSPVFVREATGLVRSLGFYDSFLLNMAVVNMAGGLAYDVLQLFFFPGANLTLVFLLGGIPAVGIFIVYTIFSSAFPRTGGDYVYVSRTLHPALGFASGMLNVFGFFIFALTGFNAWYMVFTGFPSLLSSLGAVTGIAGYGAAASYLSSQVSLDFALSTLMLVVGGLVVLFGMDVFRWSFRIIFVFYFVSAGALAVALFATNHQAFVSTLESVAGSGAYDQVLSNAGQYGNFQFSMSQTLLAFVPLGFLTFTGFQSSTYVGSEIQNPKKNQALALGVSMGITWIYLVVLAYQCENVFGDSFLQGASYLWATNPSALPLTATPFVTFLVSLIYRNVILAILLNSIPIVGGFLLIPSTLLAASRIFFAQSFDRVLPASMSRVNERLHSPLNSVLVMMVIAEIWVMVLYFYGFVAAWLSLSLATPFAWAITAIAAIVFPYVKRDLYKSSIGTLPKWMQAKPLGVPVIVWGGILQLVSMLIWIGAEFSPIITYMYLGPLIASAIGVTFGIFILSILIYYVARAWRLREGIDINIAFKEIPPE
ncbi:MAG: APC family permease [Candidatus Bathyarchaeia archaeon]